MNSDMQKARSAATGEARHSAAEVERLAKKLVGVFNDAPYMRLDSAWERVASHALDREAPLLAALERVVVESERYQLSRIISRGAWDQAERALAAHRAAHAPKEPTLAEAVKMFIKRWDDTVRVGDLDVDRMRAALAREQGGQR